MRKLTEVFHNLCILAIAVLISVGCSPSLSTAKTSTTISSIGQLTAIEPYSQSLSGEWRFNVDIGKNGEDGQWFSKEYDDSAWSTIEVPHTWNTMDEYYEYEGVAWYRREFIPEVDTHDANLRLQFDAVFYRAEVWFNGEYLGEHEGGYTPFEFNVSGLVEPSQENVITVRVDNYRLPHRIPDDFFDWWHYGGIVREVTLEITSRAYIERQFIVAVPNIVDWDEADTATVTTSVVVTNMSSQPLTGALIAEILADGTGEKAVEDLISAQVNIPPGQSERVELIATIDDPNLWHFDHPQLYRWKTSLVGLDGQILHVCDDIFGIRLIELKGGKFYLNGEPVRMVGMTRHADSPEFGLVDPYFVMAADYDDMKRLNMVLSRPVHYPQDESVLEYCDRNGILLVPEIPAWQITAKQQLSEMIIAAYNHPSIWAWSVGNEFDSHVQPGHNYVSELVALAKDLDPNRPVGFASYHLYNDQEDDATGLTDFVFMNEYCGSWAGPKEGLAEALDRIHELWPDKVVIISEYGLEAGWTTAWWIGDPSRLETDEYYYLEPGTDPYSQEVYDQRAQLIVEQMTVFRERPFVAGAIFWTYQDYRSYWDFHMGIVDAERSQAPIWEIIREQYSPVIIDSVIFSDGAGGEQKGTINIRSRGPVDVDMPAYTLRGYSLNSKLISPDGSEVFFEGGTLLPELAPGEIWSGEIIWELPDTEFLVVISISRPTGFSVWEGIYDQHGELHDD
jgi:beta-glucuronidase